MVPRATIREEIRQSAFDGPQVFYVVADECDEWGAYERFADAAERLRTRRRVERAMVTRRRNKEGA